MDNKRNRAILCVGSNLDKEKNMERAVERLRAHFISIRFAEPVYTESFDCLVPTTFLNQVAIVYSSESTEEIRSRLKEIERSLGRRPEDKALGRVPIDIDLLCWNDEILKPDDLRRDYVRVGIRSLLGEDFS